jgi:two-component system response regulator (stage 0 sporulation protein F)
MTTILVIDDDPGIRLMVTHFLGRVGHVVIAAKDGREGLRLFREAKPALVISDIIMPNQTIREIRSEAASVPIIAMSGAGSTRMVLDIAGKLGADAALEKPFRAGELIETVSKLLSPESP